VKESITVTDLKMSIRVDSRWIDSHTSKARCKNAMIDVDTDESDTRLELLHKNVKKYGTVVNTVSAGTVLNGVLRRKSS